MHSSPHSDPRSDHGFSIVEIMAATAILAVILLVIFGISQQATSAWRGARSKIEAFQGARVAFENLTSTLSQATLNTYYDYLDQNGRSHGHPDFLGAHHYGRQSDLHFISGKSLVPNQVSHALFFQTPAGYDSSTNYEGMKALLNACGYYVMHGRDPLRPGFFSSGSIPNAPPDESMYRLMQFLQPSHALGVYSFQNADWFKGPLQSASPPVQQLAENVIALVVRPCSSESDSNGGNTDLSSQYEYDTRVSSNTDRQLPAEDQLPPLVEVVLVAIDRPSAIRLGSDEIPIVRTLFQNDPADLDDELTTLLDVLREKRLVYRVFRTYIPLRNSKWSS